MESIQSGLPPVMPQPRILAQSNKQSRTSIKNYRVDSNLGTMVDHVVYDAKGIPTAVGVLINRTNGLRQPFFATLDPAVKNKTACVFGELDDSISVDESYSTASGIFITGHSTSYGEDGYRAGFGFFFDNQSFSHGFLLGANRNVKPQTSLMLNDTHVMLAGAVGEHKKTSAFYSIIESAFDGSLGLVREFKPASSNHGAHFNAVAMDEHGILAFGGNSGKYHYGNKFINVEYLNGTRLCLKELNGNEGGSVADGILDLRRYNRTTVAVGYTNAESSNFHDVSIFFLNDTCQIPVTSSGALRASKYEKFSSTATFMDRSGNSFFVQGKEGVNSDGDRGVMMAGFGDDARFSWAEQILTPTRTAGGLAGIRFDPLTNLVQSFHTTTDTYNGGEDRITEVNYDLSHRIANTSSNCSKLIEHSGLDGDEPDFTISEATHSVLDVTSSFWLKWYAKGDVVCKYLPIIEDGVCEPPLDGEETTPITTQPGPTTDTSDHKQTQALKDSTAYSYDSTAGLITTNNPTTTAAANPTTAGANAGTSTAAANPTTAEEMIGAPGTTATTSTGASTAAAANPTTAGANAGTSTADAAKPKTTVADVVIDSSKAGQSNPSTQGQEGAAQTTASDTTPGADATQGKATFGSTTAGEIVSGPATAAANPTTAGANAGTFTTGAANPSTAGTNAGASTADATTPKTTGADVVIDSSTAGQSNPSTQGQEGAAQTTASDTTPGADATQGKATFGSTTAGEIVSDPTTATAASNPTTAGEIVGGPGTAATTSADLVYKIAIGVVASVCAVLAIALVIVILKRSKSLCFKAQKTTPVPRPGSNQRAIPTTYGIVDGSSVRMTFYLERAAQPQQNQPNQAEQKVSEQRQAGLAEHKVAEPRGSASASAAEQSPAPALAAEQSPAPGSPHFGQQIIESQAENEDLNQIATEISAGTFDRWGSVRVRLNNQLFIIARASNGSEVFSPDNSI